MHKIENILVENETLNRIKNYAKAFLFQCYTGLRFSDVKQLRHEYIKDDAIILSQIKTKDIVYMPLSKPAKTILSELDVRSGLVFKIPPNQKNVTKFLKMLVNLIR